MGLNKFRRLGTIERMMHVLLLEKLNYICPDTVGDALDAMTGAGTGKAYFIAGGTDIVPMLRARAIQPECLIDLKELGLDYVREESAEIRIGAMTTFRTLTRNAVIKSVLPTLAEAANSIGAVQTRGLATIGGNLCTAVPSLDSAPPLFVYGAVLKLVSKTGERIIPVRDFFVGPRKTQLKRDEEILTEIIVKTPPAGFVSRYTKFGRRAALTLSIVNAGFGCIPEGGRITNTSTCIGACAPIPVKLTKTEEYLDGKDLDSISFDTLDELIKSEITPITDIRASKEYRSELAAALIRGHVQDILGKEGSK